MRQPLNESLEKKPQVCRSCPRGCPVDRSRGEIGFCRVGAGLPTAHRGLHFGEEPPLSGSRGSGTIFFAGCNLRCVFCQNYQISQEFQPQPPKHPAIRNLSPEELAREMLRLQDIGAHNINLVSPSHLIFALAEAIEKAKKIGLVIPVVYNSNGYDSVAALRRIRGLVDIYLPDLKCLDNALGRRFSGVDDYAEIVPAVLSEMLAQVGHLQINPDGVATRGLLVRHLVLPGSLDNSKACLELLAAISPEIYVSIMAQYSPQYKAHALPPLNRPLRAVEYEAIVDYALDLGLENAYIQELESQQHYLPDFARESPFTM
ncbi:MAG: radical SAM protein [Deltaproteobacteria bacterium]|nr:radical SAM protein [Deltaproteobacteria bacterium]